MDSRGKSMIASGLGFTVGLILLVAPVQAVSIPTLFNTGVDPSKVALAGGNGVSDPHFTFTGPGIASPTSAVTFTDAYYIANSAISRWISVNATGSTGSSGASGPWIFRTTFDLTGFNPAVTTITASCVVDNVVTSVLLNGTVVATTGQACDSYTSFHSFVINTGFVSGVNTLEFQISDAGQPIAFRAEFTSDTQALAGVPTVITVNPKSGNTISDTFTFTFSDPDGYTDLDVLNVLVNNFLDGRNGCYLAYSRPTNTLYLTNDAGTALLPGLTLNGTGNTANSYCSVAAAGSSASGNGNTLTLTLNIAFTSASFAGDKVVYMAARDLAAHNSGWQTRGVWRVPGGPAFTVSSLSPSSGNTASQTFTVVYHDNTAATNITNAQLLINKDLDGANACYLGYVRSTNQLYLVNDGGPTGLQPPITPNSGTGTAQNSQCILSGVGTTATASGNDLTLTINLTFKAAFTGAKVVYAAAQNATSNTDWQARGVWTAP